MKRWMKDVPLTMDEVRSLLHKKDRQAKWIWLGIGISVICSLIALVLWLRSRSEQATEQYFEYFDDEDLDDDYDEDFDYDDELEVEYVKLSENDDEEIDFPE